MDHPYNSGRRRHRHGFVPYDCANHRPFCINKKEYADCSGFSLRRFCAASGSWTPITPACDFVFTGGEPPGGPECLAADAGCHSSPPIRSISTPTFPVQPHCPAEKMLAFTEKNKDKITCMNISRHLVKYVRSRRTRSWGPHCLPPRASTACCIRIILPLSWWIMWSASCLIRSPSSSGMTIPRPRRRTCGRRRVTHSAGPEEVLHLHGAGRLPYAQRLPFCLQGPPHDLP